MYIVLDTNVIVAAMRSKRGASFLSEHFRSLIMAALNLRLIA